MNYLELIEKLTETQGFLIERIKKLEHVQEINERDIEKLQDEVELLKNK